MTCIDWLVWRLVLFCLPRTWSAAPSHACAAAQCGQLSGLDAQATVSYSGFDELSTAQVGCNIGYTASPAPAIYACSPEGVWTSNISVTCTAVNCGQPELPEHGEGVCTPSVFPNGCILGCEAGYTVTGNPMVLCGHTGVWSATSYNCSEITCGMPSSIPEHSAGNITSSRVGSVAIFSCEAGYELVGSSQISCQSNGAWTTPSFSCAALSTTTTTTTTSTTSSSSQCVEPTSTMVFSSTASVNGGMRFQNGNDANSRVFQLVELNVSSVSSTEFRCRCLSTCASHASCVAAYISATPSQYMCNGLSSAGIAVAFSTATTESWIVTPSQCSYADVVFLISTGSSVSAQDLTAVKQFASQSVDLFASQYLEPK